MAKEIELNVIAKTKQAEKSLSDLNKNLEKVAETGDKNREGFELLDKATGGYAGKIKDLAGNITGAIKGAKGFVTALKGVKGALLATGIGAIVVALGTIIAYWDEIVDLFDNGTKALQNQEQEHRDILAVTEQELAVAENNQRILELQGKNTTAIIEEKKKLLKQQMSENDLLVENLKNQLEILLAEQKRFKLFRDREEEAEEIAKVEEKINKAILNRQKLEINLLGIEKKARDDKKKAEEEDKKRREDDAKERKQKLEEQKAEEEKLEKEKALALERIRQGTINTEDERRKEELKKVKDQYAKLLEEAKKYYGEDSIQAQELITSRDEKLKELQDKFDKEDKDRQDKIDKEEADKKKEAQEKKLEQLELDKEFDTMTFDEQRAIVKARQDLLNEDTILSDKQKTEITKQLSEARIKIDEAETDAKLNNAMEVSGALGGLSKVAGESTVTGKALGIASATIDTYVGANKAIAKGGFTGIAQAITIIATGLKNVKSIISTKIPKVSGVSGSVGSTTPPQPQAPSFNIVGATETSQLAEAIGEQTQEPVQAYVVANDVTTAQSLQNNIVEGATL